MSGRIVLLTVLGVLWAAPIYSQYPPGQQGSSNVHVLAHLPLGGELSAADIDMEQELSRPYAYVSRFGRLGGHYGFSIIGIKEPTRPKLLYDWTIEEPKLHQGHGSIDVRHFKVNQRHYVAEAFQFRASGPDNDLGAVVVDVTGLPDTSTIKEAGRIRTPETPGGFHNVYAYKHSTGRVLLFATVQSHPSVPHGINIYDMELFLSGAPNDGLVGRIPLPEPRGTPYGGYHDAFVAYDPATRQDRFYGGGPEVTPTGGFYVWDVTDTREPKLLASIVGSAGQTGSHTFLATPDGRYVISKSGGIQPYKIFDLKPALDGEVNNITRPVGAWWATDWKMKNQSHQGEVRWPYVFVSGYQDGLHVINMMDPTAPYTVGYYDTYDGPHENARAGAPKTLVGGTSDGAWGVDVRNADGLIVVSDLRTGFWVFKMDGFDGWNGHQWGVPDNSSAQDWDRGPEGAPRPVS